MVDVFLDSLTVFTAYFWPILGFMVTMLGCGFFVVEQMMGNQADLGLRFLTGFSMGGVVLSSLAFIVVVVGHFWQPFLSIGSYGVFMLGAGVLVREIWMGRFKFGLKSCLAIGFSLGLLLVLRLAFLNRIILPPYSDSPVHYQIVTGLLNPETGNDLRLSLNNILSNYYHFGFHSLVAWLSLISGLSVEDAISLVGQLFLVIAPVSIYILTYSVTASQAGSLFAGLLAAVGWSMPAFAVNWGKYPALGAIALVPALLSALLLSSNIQPGKIKTKLWWLFLLVCITLLHTRMSIWLLLAAITFYAAGKIHIGEQMSFPQSIRFSLLFCVSLMPFYRTLLDFYPGFFVAILLLVLLPFAFRAYPGLSTHIFLFTFLLWLAAVVPVSLGREGQTLLDKQFVAMTLYIPFSVLGGAGLAGFMTEDQIAAKVRRLAFVIVAAGVLSNFSIKNLYPDSCCDYVKDDDQKALQWISNNTSDQTLFLISAFGAGSQSIGTDAGIWISPLTGQPANKLPYDIDWSSSTEMDEICGFGAAHIYVYAGGSEYSFFVDDTLSRGRLEPRFRSGQTVIYQVSGCQGHN